MNIPSRADLTVQSPDTLRHSVAELEQLTATRQAELERAQAALADARRAWSIAQEVLAERSAEVDPTFTERWRELLNTVGEAPGRSDRLHKAFDEFVDANHRPYIRGAWTIRRDNRQAILALFTPSDPDVVERAHLTLLALLPVLVNESNPKLEEQAAVISVMSRNISDKEQLTLIAHPKRGRYELSRDSRWETTVEHRADCLRDMMRFLAEHHPYY